jgi:hypothetical protein
VGNNWERLKKAVDLKCETVKVKLVESKLKDLEDRINPLE